MIYSILQEKIHSYNADLNRQYCENFMFEKKELIDRAFSGGAVKSFAELGCVWGVDCAYGLYARGKYDLSKLIMVDAHWTETAKEKCAEYSNIIRIEDNFGKADMPEKMGHVDAVILFDVLLHQVAPDWNRVLQIYAPYTKSFIIYNQQFIASPISVRLLDLGKEEYFKNVPHDPEHPTYMSLFSKMWELNTQHKRIWRDIHHVWQWGITDKDLIATLEQLNFKLEYFCNHGRQGYPANFEGHAFIFTKV
jgi:hypothetical protein